MKYSTVGVGDMSPRAILAARPPYMAAELFVENAPNVWAVMKRATPGARAFNGEVLARCISESVARQFANLLNESAQEVR